MPYMIRSFKIFAGLLFFIPILARGQDTTRFTAIPVTENKKIIYGFIRGGIYGNLDNSDDKPYISTAFSDLGLKIESEDGLLFKAYADLRFRYGSEFLEPVSKFDIREAYVKINGRHWDITAGQKIIKWGRADFTNPTSKLSPQNMISRSPDREDMDMGNLLSTIKWFPSPYITMEAVALPYFHSSNLIISPVPLPENVTINEISSLITDKKMFSYGLRSDIHLKGIDWSLSWFDGYDPMPGTALTGFNLDLSGPIPVPETELTFKPYKLRIVGLDFESSAGKFGFRGEAAWSDPYLLNDTAEYVPFPEIKWVTGMDWASGVWRITGEYSGKRVLDFKPAGEDPIIGTEPDYARLAELLLIPGFDITEYVRQQVGAFNRLYNYQMEKLYHSAGLRIEADLAYGKLAPSVFTQYNFTSRDLLVIPEIKYKPADGLTITAGAEFYSGRKGSLFDIVNDFMNCIYVGLKVDF